RCVAAVRPREVLCAVVRREREDRVVLKPVVSQVLHDRADDIVGLCHSCFLDAPAVLWRAHALVLLRKVRDDMHPGWIEPKEERFTVLPCLVEEHERVGQYLIVDGLHALRAQFTRILYFLLSYFAPARLYGRIVYVCRPCVEHIARSDTGFERWWIGAMTGVLHCIEVIEIRVEFIEAVDCRQELIYVAQMVLAELARGATHRL